MQKIILISCASRKRTIKSRARDLYISPLFRKNLLYANNLKPDKIFILSAKYGLIGLDNEIEPYDMTLKAMSIKETKHWAIDVLNQLSRAADLKQDLFIFLAGEKYRRYLIPSIAKFEIPMEGLRIGEQLQKLAE